MNHDELRDSIPALALNALPRAEQVLVEAHVSLCSGCSFEYRQYQEVAALLAHLVPAVTPPPSLWTRIEAGLDREPDRPAPAPAPLAPATSPSPNGTPRAATWRGRHSRRALAALATAAGLIVGGVGVSLLNRPDVQAPHGGRPGQSLYEAIVSGPHTTRTMHPTTLAPGTRGAIFVAPDGKVAVRIQDLPPPRSGIYAMWLISDGQALRLGDFRPDASGEVEMASPVNAGRSPHLVATLESGAGHSSPSGRPILET